MTSVRLFVLVIVVTLATWVAGLAFFAYVAIENHHQAQKALILERRGTVKTCRALEELKAQIRLAAIDLGVDPAIVGRFQTHACGKLPELPP